MIDEYAKDIVLIDFQFIILTFFKFKHYSINNYYKFGSLQVISSKKSSNMFVLFKFSLTKLVSLL
jgi:hypothetical protein